MYKTAEASSYTAEEMDPSKEIHDRQWNNRLNDYEPHFISQARQQREPR